MTRPRMLDLFCGRGGAAQGYLDAGFDVVGVDTGDYAAEYPARFIQGDAIDYAWEHSDEYDVIHASPPCQHASAGTRAHDRSRYPALIDATRVALAASGRPYVIENVKGADLHNPVVLCGTMFNLTATDTDGTVLHLQRHRLFESNLPLSNATTPHPHHHPPGVQWAGSYGGARRDKVEARQVRHGGYVPSVDVQRELLGIGWMSEAGLYQAIPPAYTAYLGRQLLASLGREVAVS